MHLQWLNTDAIVALIDANSVSGTYHVLAKTRTREQMIENAAVLVRVLKRAHASRFKKYQEKIEREGEEEKASPGAVNRQKRYVRNGKVLFYPLILLFFFIHSSPSIFLWESSGGYVVLWFTTPMFPCGIMRKYFWLGEVRVVVSPNTYT